MNICTLQYKCELQKVLAVLCVYGANAVDVNQIQMYILKNLVKWILQRDYNSFNALYFEEEWLVCGLPDYSLSYRSEKQCKRRF